MKNNIKLLVLLFLSVNIILSSCKKDENLDPNSAECMDFVDLDSYFAKAIYIDFIDNNNGWIIGKKVNAKHSLLNTADGGASWSEINNDFILNYDNGIVNGEALQFVTATNGVKNIKYASADSKFTLQFTKDKGATWTEYVNPFSVGQNFYKVNHWAESYASNGTETIIFGTDYSGTTPFNDYVLKINNASMEITYSKIFDGGMSQTKLESNAGNSYQFSANNTITAINIDNDTKIIQSTDNGDTWNTRTDALEGEFLSASWPTGNIGFIAFGGNSITNIQKTIDGGATWSKVNTSSIPKLLIIRFADKNNGIALSSFDLYSTTDGGVTWTKIECRNTDSSYASGVDEVLAYPSINNGWVPGTLFDNKGLNGKNGVFNFKGE